METLKRLTSSVKSGFKKIPTIAKNTASKISNTVKEAKIEGERLNNDTKDDFINNNIGDKPKITNPKIAELVNKIEKIIEANKKGYAINLEEKELFDNYGTELEKLASDKDIPTQTEAAEALQYIDNLKETTKTLELKEENIVHTKKTIIQFKQIANICKIPITILTVICIILLLITLLISLINVINLSIKLLTSIVSLFYNTIITNNQTISYSAKEIIKCTKNDFKYDIFNILNEQSTSFTVFNTVIYIIYILLFYILLYILAIIFANIYQYTHVLNGDIKDIDPKFQLLTIIGIIFVSSFIHLLIYKLIFRKLSFNKFKDINNYEVNLDNLISNNLSPINTEYDNEFFDLMTDSTKRTEIDNMFAKMVEDIDQPSTNLSKYLLMYDLYMYFDEYVYMNDVVKDDLRKYFKLVPENNIDKTFISFLDANQRKLIKLYHEELPFYKQIPTNKLEAFQKTNEKVSQTIGTINKSIIKYIGTFYPFLICCIYIIGIFLFNVICTYIVMDFILTTQSDNIFPSFIYTIAFKYKELINHIYNIFKL